MDGERRLNLIMCLLKIVPSLSICVPAILCVPLLSKLIVVSPIWKFKIHIKLPDFINVNIEKYLLWHSY